MKNNNEEDNEQYEEQSVVGTIINFRGMVYSPINEQGVVLLFGKILKDLNMYVEEIKTGYPDCIARRRTGKGWEKISIEFEFKSSRFKDHLGDLKKGRKCDLVVCWINDWKECPVPVLELKEEIKSMEPEPFGEEEIKEETKYTLKYHIERKNVNKNIQELFEKLNDSILKINEEIYNKYSKTAITYYSPEKNFVYLKFRKGLIDLDIYTKEKKVEGVKNTKFHENWGTIKIRSERDLQTAINAIKKSYSLMKQAIKENINTGWYAVTPKEKMTWINKEDSEEENIEPEE